MILVILGMVAVSAAQTQWTLQQSTLSYHVSHPLHTADGISHAARGKGVCNGTTCDFLMAVPVKSFESGDSNRDLHMLQVTRGAQYPMVSVRTQIPESSLVTGTIHADLQVAFAGQTVDYKQVPLQLVISGAQAHITGTIPATLTDFKIDPPTLLTIPIKNDIPVHLDMTWVKQ